MPRSPSGERRARCCSLVPCRKGLGSTLGFGAPPYLCATEIKHTCTHIERPFLRHEVLEMKFSFRSIGVLAPFALVGLLVTVCSCNKEQVDESHQAFQGDVESASSETASVASGFKGESQRLPDDVQKLLPSLEGSERSVPNESSNEPFYFLVEDVWPTYSIHRARQVQAIILALVEKPPATSAELWENLTIGEFESQTV